MPKKGETIIDVIRNRYWITPEGEAALEQYAKEHSEDKDE